MDENATSCLEMTCKARKIAIKTVANNVIDSWIECVPGKYSEGINHTTCLNMTCPDGYIARLVPGGAITALNGCDACLTDNYSIWGIIISCSSSFCPSIKIVSKTASFSNKDCCVGCDVGKYSPGGDNNACIEINCNSGY